MAEEASTKKGKYEGMSQKKFEDMIDKQMKGVVKQTEKMAKAACASVIEGTGSNPPMARAEPGEARGEKGKKLPKKEKN